MTRTVVPRIEVAPKPPAPNLASLLRVKGIMDFGKSQSNEAIIEILRVNQTRSFKVGETVPDAGATITKIDSAVTFAYDGKSVRLEVNATESAELPTAGIGGETLSDGSARSKP
ncbi:MAG TPA: hypothetical protein VEK08_21725 [Planctomycetota bacterium]|nr:hypothetical protein [Planctomycetota bacterium]